MTQFTQTVVAFNEAGMDVIYSDGTTRVLVQGVMFTEENPDFFQECFEDALEFANDGEEGYRVLGPDEIFEEMSAAQNADVRGDVYEYLLNVLYI